MEYRRKATSKFFLSCASSVSASDSKRDFVDKLEEVDRSFSDIC